METLENKAKAIKYIEKQIGKPISDVPQYIKMLYDDRMDAWHIARSAMKESDIGRAYLDEAQKKIRSLEAQIERYKQSNRDL